MSCSFVDFSSKSYPFHVLEIKIYIAFNKKRDKIVDRFCVLSRCVMVGECLSKSFFTGVLLNIVPLTANATMLDNEGAIVKLLTDKKAPTVLESKSFSMPSVTVNADLLTDCVTGHNISQLLNGEVWRADQDLSRIFLERYENALRETCWYYASADAFLVIIDHSRYSTKVESLMQYCREEYKKKKSEIPTVGIRLFHEYDRPAPPTQRFASQHSLISVLGDDVVDLIKNPSKTQLSEEIRSIIGKLLSDPEPNKTWIKELISELGDNADTKDFYNQLLKIVDC